MGGHMPPAADGQKAEALDATDVTPLGRLARLPTLAWCCWQVTPTILGLNHAAAIQAGTTQSTMGQSSRHQGHGQVDTQGVALFWSQFHQHIRGTLQHQALQNTCGDRHVTSKKQPSAQQRFTGVYATLWPLSRPFS